MHPCVNLHWSATLRSLIAVAAERDYTLRQVDIGNAFVETLLHPGEEVYMDSIPGYERPGSVPKLARSLYGLKNSLSP